MKKAKFLGAENAPWRTGHDGEAEVPLKEWVAQEATRTELSPSTIYHQVKRGNYALSLRRVNARVIFVRPAEHQDNWWGAAVRKAETGNARKGAT